MMTKNGPTEEEEEQTTNTTLKNDTYVNSDNQSLQQQPPPLPSRAKPKHRPARAVHRYGTKIDKANLPGHPRTTSDAKDNTAKEVKATKYIATNSTAANISAGIGPLELVANQKPPTNTDSTTTLTPTTTTPPQPQLPLISYRKNLSQTNLTKTKSKSNGDFHRGNTKSTEKLASNHGTTRVSGPQPPPPTASRAQVHFALGNDGEGEDEWVDADASGPASPYLSRNASVKSERSSHSAPKTDVDSSEDGKLGEPSSRAISSHELTTAQHKEYLTTRLLQRTPSCQHVVPPKISPLMASASQTNSSNPTSTAPTAVPQHQTSSTAYDTPLSNVNATVDSQGEGLTSRFVAPNSGISGEGSFYNPTLVAPTPTHGATRTETSTSLPTSRFQPEVSPSDKDDERALAPKPNRRFPAPGTGDNYRTQKKLELQRASAVIEPGQAAGSGAGISSLVGFGGPGFDSGGRADPRVAKLLERTSMEYLVVRRYQNPVNRSFRRLPQPALSENVKKSPRSRTGLSIEAQHGDGLGNGKIASEISGHSRNNNLPEQGERHTGVKRPSLSRAVSTVDVVDNDGSRPGDRFAVGDISQPPLEEGLVEGSEDQVAMFLQSIWDHPIDFGVCQ